MNRLSTARSLTAALVSVICFTTQVFAAGIYIKIDDIKGESQAQPGAIDVLAYSHGISNSGTAHIGGGGGAGKASFSDISLAIESGPASVQLIQACTMGISIDKAELTIVKPTAASRTYRPKAGETPEEYMKIEMKDVLISSYSSGGSGGGDSSAPTENVSLNFAEITYIYTKNDSVTEFTWDLRELTQ